MPDLFTEEKLKNISQGSTLIDQGYTSQLEDSTISTITSRGAMVEIDADIHAPMENMIIQDTVVKTLTYGSGDTSVVQIFKASEDNLHDVRFTMKGSGAVSTIDTMEYASDAAARAVWDASDTTNTQVYSEATIKMQGSYSLKVRCRKIQSPGDTITKTISATDYSGKSIRFRRYNDVGNGKCTWRLRISDDGVDWLYSDFTSVNANVWEELNINVDSMVLVGTSVNTAAITKVQFYMVECINSDHYFYIDQMELIGVGGILFFKLYNFGTTQNPTTLSQGTQMTFDEGSTQIEIDPPTNKAIINVHAHLGAHDRTTNLTKGNYYGLVLTGVTSGSVDIYGSSTQLYNSGKFFTEVGGALTQTTKSLRFICFSIVDSVLLHAQIKFNASPGESVIYMPCSDATNNGLMDDFRGTVYCWSETTLPEMDFTLTNIPAYYSADCPFRPIYNDNAVNSLATEIKIRTHWAYNPINTYG